MPKWNHAVFVFCSWLAELSVMSLHLIRSPAHQISFLFKANGMGILKRPQGADDIQGDYSSFLAALDFSGNDP